MTMVPILAEAQSLATPQDSCFVAMRSRSVGEHQDRESTRPRAFARCWITPTPVTWPARPLCSATGSAAALKVGRQPPGQRADFRVARIRQSGRALSFVVPREHDIAAAGYRSPTRSRHPPSSVPRESGARLTPVEKPAAGQRRTRQSADATPATRACLEVGDAADRSRPSARLHLVCRWRGQARSGRERPVELSGGWRLPVGVGGGLLLGAPDGVALFKERGHALLRVVRERVLGHD